MPAFFQPAVIDIDGGVNVAVGLVSGVGEEHLDIGQQGRPVGLQGQQLVASALGDGSSDLDLGSDGIDGDLRPGQFQALQQ